MAEIRNWVDGQLKAMETMQVSYRGRVIALAKAPEIVQLRWLKERVREYEASLKPEPKEQPNQPIPSI